MANPSLRPVAIHHRKDSFSERWIEACKERNIPFEVVDAHRPDIMATLARVRALLWHFHMQEPDIFMARHVLRAAEGMGLPVFPNSATAWHFDDKVAQKYLLEAIGAPLAQTWVFYDRKQALEWIESTGFPKVFKLRRGSGSRNVRLVRDRGEAARLVNQAFGRGFRASGLQVTGELWKIQRAAGRKELLPFLLGLPAKARRRLAFDTVMGRERGYVYFQDFIPDNKFDTRITVIGSRAFGFTRDIRPDDFRASGSGRIVYDQTRIRRRCLEVAFEAAARIGSQSMAFDFVFDPADQIRLLEISLGYDPNVVHGCEGHWNSNFEWIAGRLRPEDAILEDLLGSLRS